MSLHLKPGELAIVLGPTGAGKTTMLRAAAGLLQPSSGSVMVDEHPVMGRGAVRGAVGLVFQRPEAQFFAPSVEEDCAFGPRNLGRSPDEAVRSVRDALSAVGLDPDTFSSREPWGLSGGEARRAAIACVLAMRPSYLLLDEPTAGLDAAGRSAVISAIAGVRQAAGVLVVTHDPDLFLSDADRVMVLRDGSAAFSGSVDAFLDALPELVAAGSAEAPEVARTQFLAQDAGVLLPGRLTLDPRRAAERLAAGVRGAR
ncbi:MAG: ABC transporter ATP-binding protein [Coriobacteriia bacterium]|nr:ABC transporter ATP-binding protein [Coriobacteriia bacterium]